MSDPNWTGRAPHHMRHDYAHCGYVYQCKSHRLLRIAQAIACLLVFAAIGVMLAWRM